VNCGRQSIIQSHFDNLLLFPSIILGIYAPKIHCKQIVPGSSHSPKLLTISFTKIFNILCKFPFPPIYSQQLSLLEDHTNNYWCLCDLVVFYTELWHPLPSVDAFIFASIVSCSGEVLAFQIVLHIAYSLVGTAIVA
jgi:hypothetical protein